MDFKDLNGIKCKDETARTLCEGLQHQINELTDTIRQYQMELTNTLNDLAYDVGQANGKVEDLRHNYSLKMTSIEKQFGTVYANIKGLENIIIELHGEDAVYGPEDEGGEE